MKATIVRLGAEDAEAKRAKGLTPEERAQESANAKENLLRILEAGYDFGPFRIKLSRKEVLPLLNNAEIYIRRQAEMGALKASPEIERKVRSAAGAAVKPIVGAGLAASIVAAIFAGRIAGGRR